MTATLLRNLFELLTQGLINPRATVRRIIDEEPSLADRLLLVGLAAAMQGALWALTSVLVQGIGGGIGFGGQIRLAFQVFIKYVITATLAYNIGIRFGGKGTVPQVATAVAWHAMLTAALTPVLALAVGGAGPEAGMSAGGALLVLLYAGFNIWLLANCIAEAHDFDNVGKVAAVTFGLSLAVGFVLLLIVGGLLAA
jgi:hypothetical protein